MDGAFPGTSFGNNYSRANGYPSGSKSASGSPGLMRFHHTYRQEYVGPKISFDQTAAANEPCTVNQYTMGWCNDFERIPYASSRPSSVMSGMSNMSCMSQLTVCTDFSSAPMQIPQQYLSDPTQCENNNPREKSMPGFDVNGYLFDLLRNIESDQIVNWDQQMSMLCKLTKRKEFNYVSDDAIIKLFDKLFMRLHVIYTNGHWCENPVPSTENPTSILSAFHAFLAVKANNEDTRLSSMFKDYVVQSQGRAVWLLLRFVWPHSDFLKFLMVILNNLLSDNAKRFIHNQLRRRHILKQFHEQPDCVQVLVNAIQPEHKAVLNLTMDNLKLVLHRQKEGKVRFCNLNGIDIVLNILATEHVERPLYHAASLLSVVLSDELHPVLDRFVILGGIQTCAKLLTHGSSRLLQKLLGVIVAVSDLAVTQQQDLGDSIKMILNLVGADDIDTVNKAISSLANFCTNHVNKVHLSKYGAPTVFLRALDDFRVRMSNVYPIKDEVIDHTLWALQALIRNYKAVEDRSQHVCEEIAGFARWKRIMLSTVEHDLMGSVNRALLILNEVLSRCPMTDTESQSQENHLNDYAKVFSRLMAVMQCRFDRGNWVQTGLYRFQPTDEAATIQQSDLCIKRSLTFFLLLLKQSPQRVEIARHLLESAHILEYLICSVKIQDVMLLSLQIATEVMSLNLPLGWNWANKPDLHPYIQYIAECNPCESTQQAAVAVIKGMERQYSMGPPRY